MKTTETKSRFPITEQLHNEQFTAFQEHLADERDQISRVLKEYSYPSVRGRATIAPVTDDPWAGVLELDKPYDIDERNAIEPNDRPPTGWLTIKPETRERSLGVALYLCDLFPRDSRLVGERKDKLRSAIGMVWIVLASGEVPIGLSPADSTFFAHFVLPPAERVAWREAHIDILHHFGQAGVSQLQHELIERMDRVTEGSTVAAAIKAGIARAVTAFKTRRSLRDPWMAR